MFAQSVFRTAQQPLRCARLSRPVRRQYATESGSSSSSNTTVFGVLAAVAGIGAGYYYLNRPSPALSKASGDTTREAPKSPHPSEEVNHTSSEGSTSAPNAAFQGGDQGWISLKLDNVEQYNHNTKKFRFLLPDPEDVSGLRIASALLLKYQGPGMDKPIIRPYTPVSDENAKGYLDFIIKRYPNGPMSERLHQMSPEQRLDFKGPLPKYPWSPNKHEHIGLIAGGTGITPMYQLIRAIFSNPADTTKVTLIFGNISEDDILLKHELHELENTYPQRFRAYYTLDKPSDKWMGATGYITKDLLKTVLPEPKMGEKVKLFVCGPPGLYRAISGTKKSPSDQGELEGALKELGYSKEQVYKF